MFLPYYNSSIKSVIYVKSLNFNSKNRQSQKLTRFTVLNLIVYFLRKKTTYWKIQQLSESSISSVCKI